MIIYICIRIVSILTKHYSFFLNLSVKGAVNLSSYIRILIPFMLNTSKKFKIKSPKLLCMLFSYIHCMLYLELDIRTTHMSKCFLLFQHYANDYITAYIFIQHYAKAVSVPHFIKQLAVSIKHLILTHPLYILPRFVPGDLCISRPNATVDLMFAASITTISGWHHIFVPEMMPLPDWNCEVHYLQGLHLMVSLVNSKFS